MRGVAISRTGVPVLAFFCLMAADSFAQVQGPIQALSLNGTTGDYVIASDFSGRGSPFPRTEITVEFWMRTSNTSKDGTPLSYATTGEANTLLIHNYRSFQCRINNVIVETGVSANNGQWQHMALTWRNTGELLFYRNGSQVFSAANIANGFSFSSLGTLVIGQDQDSRGGGFESSQAFLGTIDEIRIWNRRRSAFEIRNDMHRSLVGNESGLVLYYRLDENTGTVANDATSFDFHGTIFGALHVPSTAPVGLPVGVSTFPVLSRTTVSGVLRGQIDPNGLNSGGHFRWAPTPSLGSDRVTPNVVSTGPNTPIDMDYTLVGLQPSTTYYYQAVGSNAIGSVLGPVRSFSTLGPPSVTTEPANPVTSDSATLHATINPRDAATTAYFEYGLDAGYGSTTPTNELAPGATNVPISASISGLIFDRTYHYRAVASNNRGTAFGANRTFRTQIFGEVEVGLPALAAGDAAWGDYDNDGDLDLVLTGNANGAVSTGQSHIWRNNGDGTFTNIGAGLPGVSFGAAAWGDYDNDDDLDLLLTGSSTADSALTQLRRNDGNGTFNLVASGLPPMTRSSVAWGDYDQDGDLDLLLSGTTNGGAGGAACQIHRNNGDGTFASINAGLPGIFDGSAAWADYDNDGDLDLALSGSGAARVSQIRRNDGTGTFTDINAGLPGASSSALAWGDYDNDGDPDLLLAGTTDGQVNGAFTQLWRNEGNGTFADAGAALPRLHRGALAWADFDNDGDADLVLSGRGTNFMETTELRRNDGGGTFTTIMASLPGLESGSVAWGDFDNDSDLDLLLMGFGESEVLTHLRRNDSFPANSVPAAPTGLAYSLTPSNTVFYWDPAMDAHTPAAGVTYNLRIGRTPQAGDILSGESDPLTGHRLAPQIGNAQQGTNATVVLTNLPGGTYYWTVQAVDSAFGGGPFAPTEVFELIGPPNVTPAPPAHVTTRSATLQAFVNPGGRNTAASFEFGMSANYGTQFGTTNLGNGFEDILIASYIDGLAPDTIYHYRANALSILGAVNGADVSFRTHFLSISPPVLALALAPGAATSVPLIISNHTAAAASITNRFAAPAPSYAALLPATASVAANGMATVNVLLDATDLNPGLNQSTLLLDAGSDHAIATVPIQLTVQIPEPSEITSVNLLPDGNFVLNFAATSGFAHTVLASSDVTAPLDLWVALGPATEIAPGQFQFSDPDAGALPQRFYQVRTE